MDITKKYNINGPNNVVRLEKGSKVLYIFGDVHLEPHLQTECIVSDKHESIDFDKLISQFMKTEKKKQFDIFAEMYDIHFMQGVSPYREKYIHQFFKLFEARLKKEDKTVKINPNYPNFRLHFMDIRNTIILFEKLFYFYSRYAGKNVMHKEMVKDFEEFINDCKTLLKYLSSPKNKYIDKILNRYTHNDIKQTMNHLYKTLVIDILNDIIKMAINIVEDLKISQYKDKKFNDKLNKNILYLLNQYIVYFFCVITDLYFLRRFLDKNYIGNAILYTGLIHMVDITYILVKYFGFKLTNVYYIDKKLKSTLVGDKIQKFNTKQLDYIDKLNILMEQRYGNGKNAPIYQCVNLFDFPADFR